MKNIEFKIKASDFLTAIKRVKHCMGDNETRRNLMGINLSVSEDKPDRLNIIAADSFRVARQSIAVTADESFNITIAHYTIKNRDIEKYLKQYEKIDKTITYVIEKSAKKTNTLHFKDDPDCLEIFLDNDEYPTDSINRLLNSSESKNNKITVIDINNFYRASEYLYYASEHTVLKLSLSEVKEASPGTKKRLNLETAIPSYFEEFRQVSFNISAKDGNSAEPIGLNIRFLKEALKVFKTLKACNLTLSYKDRESPCFLKTETNNTVLETGYTFIQLILPVKLKYI